METIHREVVFMLKKAVFHPCQSVKNLLECECFYFEMHFAGTGETTFL